jgi:sodium-dependent dicarboxylate transporter 2/3/5
MSINVRVSDKQPTPREAPGWRQLPIDRIGLVLGPVVMLGWLLWPRPEILSPEAHRFAGVFLLTVIWWITEPIPIAATGLLSVVLAGLVGVLPADWEPSRISRTLFAPFASPSVFFLIGSLFIGCAMTRHGLDRRIALRILSTRWAGRSPSTILLGVGLATMLVSMWVSNVAATAMIFPVTIGIIDVLALNAGGEEFRRSKYASALLLMTGFASTVGGIATPIGTSTNVIARGFFQQEEYFGRSVDFARWTVVGLPLAMVIMLGLFGWLRVGAKLPDYDMTRMRAYLRSECEKLGSWKRGEINTLVTFLIVVGLWVAPSVLGALGLCDERDWLERHLPEEIVSILAPILLFLLPIDYPARKFTLEPADFNRIDWGTMLLFGAGLSLGKLMEETGLAQAIGQSAFAAMGTTDVWTVTAAVTLGAVLFSDFSSNTATAATLIPIVHALCKGAEIDPLPPMIGVTFGASFGSALPVSTPPNAIVYGSGLIPVRRMLVAGLGLDLIAAATILAGLHIAFALGWTPFAN